MVQFQMTMGGVHVLVDSKTFGHIDREGFFTDISFVREFVRVSREDMTVIMAKVREVTQGV